MESKVKKLWKEGIVFSKTVYQVDIMFSYYSWNAAIMNELSESLMNTLQMTNWTYLYRFWYNSFLCVLLSCFSRVRLSATLWTIARQAPLSMDSPGKNTGLHCHSLLQGILPIQGSNLGPLHHRQILYLWATREAPEFPFT